MKSNTYQEKLQKNFPEYAKSEYAKFSLPHHITNNTSSIELQYINGKITSKFPFKMVNGDTLTFHGNIHGEELELIFDPFIVALELSRQYNLPNLRKTVLEIEKNSKSPYQSPKIEKLLKAYGCPNFAFNTHLTVSEICNLADKHYIKEVLDSGILKNQKKILPKKTLDSSLEKISKLAQTKSRVSDALPTILESTTTTSPRKRKNTQGYPHATKKQAIDLSQPEHAAFGNNLITNSNQNSNFLNLNPTPKALNVTNRASDDKLPLLFLASEELENSEQSIGSSDLQNSYITPMADLDLILLDNLLIKKSSKNEDLFFPENFDKYFNPQHKDFVLYDDGETNYHKVAATPKPLPKNLKMIFNYCKKQKIDLTTIDIGGAIVKSIKTKAMTFAAALFYLLPEDALKHAQAVLSNEMFWKLPKKMQHSFMTILSGYHLYNGKDHTLPPETKNNIYEWLSENSNFTKFSWWNDTYTDQKAQLTKQVENFKGLKKTQFYEARGALNSKIRQLTVAQTSATTTSSAVTNQTNAPQPHKKISEVIDLEQDQTNAFQLNSNAHMSLASERLPLSSTQQDFSSPTSSVSDPAGSELGGSQDRQK